jgi:glycosyltransferase involved in cell wall biosynthesis
MTGLHDPADDIELSIVMPCLNESETLTTCIQKARRFLDERGVRGEIVVADNGSTDGSEELARAGGARVVDVPARGYGAALYYGCLAARGRYIIMGDSDDSYDFTSLMPFVEELRRGRDLVMGNRFLGGIKPGAMPWKNRHIGNPVLTAIGRLFFSSNASDFHCGLRGFSSAAFRRLDLRTTGMEFASEMVIKASVLGLVVSEVPTTLSPDGRSRPPHLRPWRDGWRHLRFMLLFSPKWLFLYPGLALLAVGIITGALLVRGPIHVGGSVLDIHTLVYAAAAVSIGFQSVVFAVFTKVFAIQEGLLPPDRRLTSMFRYVTLETGLVVGGILFAAGLAGTISAFLAWSAVSFGGLSPEQMMRRVIPSVLALVLGAEVILSSFLLSVLGLGIRRAQPSPTP